jgi:ABC-type sugar transport system ATPase subunit
MSTEAHLPRPGRAAGRGRSCPAARWGPHMATWPRTSATHQRNLANSSSYHWEGNVSVVTQQRDNESSDQPRKLAFKAVGVKKHYPGVKALDGVDLEGYAGSVLGVCGANGAGKSTFAKLLAGVETPTDGEITVTGYPHPVRNAAEAEQAGVLMMHQEPLIIDDFTVGENVWLYKLRAGKDIRPWAVKVDTNSAHTQEVLRGVGLGHLSTRDMAKDLGPGQRQMLSLSRAAVTTHKIMILDETTASTSEEHFNDILDLVRREKEAGTSIIFVSHRLNEVFAMCDRIAVLRNGKLVKVLDAADQGGRPHRQVHLHRTQLTRSGFRGRLVDRRGHRDRSQEAGRLSTRVLHPGGRHRMRERR